MLDISINLKPSKQFICLILCNLISLLVIIIFLDIALIIKVLLASSVFIYCSYILWKDGLLKHRYSIIRFCFDKNGWSIANQTQTLQARLMGDSTVTAWLCVLRFSVPGKYKKYACVIFRDMMRPDEYRRLLIALKCAGN